MLDVLNASDAPVVLETPGAATERRAEIDLLRERLTDG